jgi:hypothetical protein
MNIEEHPPVGPSTAESPTAESPAVELPAAGDQADEQAGEPPRLSAVAADTLGDFVDAVIQTDRVIAAATAWRAEQIDHARRWSQISIPVTTSAGMTPWSQAETARRTLVSELACALRLPERTTQNLVAESEMLVQQLPATLEALRTGDLSYRHAQVVIDHARSLPEKLRSEFELTVLPFARTHTVAKLDRKARATRERMDPATIAERHAKCRDDRRLEFEPARDGMAWLHHYLPAADALAIYNRATDIGTAMQGRNEPRTLAQLRSDAATDLLLDGEVPGRGEFSIRPWVAVTVPVLTLLGLGGEHGDVRGENDGKDDGEDDRVRLDGRLARQHSEPATLDGYGPIDDDTARRLAGAAPSFLRILTHPETGAVLSVGRDRYTVPADLRAWLRVRDGTCRKPGCGRTAARCDLDHTEEWQHHGQTAHDNLTHLCRAHHAEKHHTGWQLKHVGDGVIEWTSPGGRNYLSEPANRIRPAPARASARA